MATVGKRLIRNLTILDVEHWYEEWRKPVEPRAPERIDRAHDAVSMFKTVLRFNAALRRPDCKQLVEELKFVKFEKGGARSEEMTPAHALAFIRAALDLETKRVIPERRGLYMAIGVAAQFELMLREGRHWGMAPRRKVAQFLQVGELLGVAMAHENLEVEVSRWRRVRSDPIRALVPFARAGGP